VFRFLHAAQSQGYGEVALDYLQQLLADGTMPKALEETWDLELSRSYRAAAAEAYNAAEAQDRMAKAQTHLDKFLKEHPEHAEVARAMESWGDLTLDRALEHLRIAGSINDPAIKQQQRDAARTDLEEARPRFADATKRYFDRFQALQAENKQNQSVAGGRPRVSSTNRKLRAAEEALREAELAWLDCRFKSAKIDFYLGQTYPDPKSKERQAALESAAKAFDAIFQSYRESLVGLHAHLWHGRSVDELGQDQLAYDIYEEVLATAPEGRERETGLEPLFAQTQYHRLLVLRRLKGFKEFLQQADEWLQLRRAWRAIDAYQGVALEVARTNLEHAEEIGGPRKNQLVQASLAQLAEIARVRGAYQQDAILLRRELNKSNPQDLSNIKTFDEALAVGESAAESLDWPSAAAALTKALELSSTTKDAERVATARTRLDYANYQLAAGHYAAGRVDEALALARQIAEERGDSALAPPASALAVSAALSQYAQVKDKQAALAQLETLAKQTIDRWPDKPEADDARIALGQASLVRGDAAAALAVFENVDPRSPRFPTAMALAGQTHWRLYLGEKNKGHQADAAQLSAERAKAQEQLRTSLDAMRKAAPAGEPLSRPLVETQLLVAEIATEAGDPQQAVELVDPLVEWIKTNKPEQIDNVLLRVFLTAARAHLALGQVDRAAAAATVLSELGPDNAAVNGVLVSIVKSISDSWKQAAAEVIEAGTAGDAPRRTAAETAAAARKQLVGQLVARLVPRKEQSLAALIFVADTSAELDQADAARALYEQILAQGDADPAFKEANAPALTRVRVQLVGLLRRKAQTSADFAAGIEQVDQLIAAHPNALEPKMEKGRLLQAWAEIEPDHFNDAVAHWTTLRTRLSRARSKPPEYYEVVYNAANCLFLSAVKARSTEQALQAEQLLNATLVLSPRLSGPEMVAQYKDLLKRARQLQGRAAPGAAG